MAEINTIFKDWKDEGIVISPTFIIHLIYLAYAEDRWFLENNNPTQSGGSAVVASFIDVIYLLE